ncbi:pentatricopeptide repeat-containing protein At2g17033 isoform X1 [Cucurbita maxima]|uniref:Pentatricopeptide repeat-containing protein At2g17033 isoform X1 n=1 Tax=Cucurbita maxima TaxID=3661 RepID=A0A6J1JE75_CUCMA|nr:pentatricopeptide repeat-containing protein At2g17033 isoform X1 [Cucurbita maxima]
MELRLCPPPYVIGDSVRLFSKAPKRYDGFCSYHFRPNLQVKCATLTKQSHRFLSTLATTAAAGDHSATNRLIRKFVASSPKSITLNVLSDILSSRTAQPGLCSVARILYSRITETSWFAWNSKLVADLVAFLDKNGQIVDSETLISEAISKLGIQERKLVNFYCQLVESQSKHGSERGFRNAYACLHELLYNSSSIYVKRRAYESMVTGLCSMKRPQEAESLVKEMKAKGFAPAAFEYRSIIYAYGTLGLFEDMKRSLEEMKNDHIALDTVCSNMVLSSYGVHNKLADMVLWLQIMKTSALPFSVRTYNSVLNSCPKITSMLQDKSGDLPVLIEDLISVLDGDEALLVEELVGSSVLREVMVWDAMEMKLDLHGAHVGAAYVIILEWMKEMRLKFENESCVIPAQVTVICGSGNHSIVRRESPVKALIREIMFRTQSPLRIDRKNTGCFVAKGKAVKNWWLPK